MQVMKVIGVETNNFTPKNSEVEVRGYNVYVVYERKNVEGVACERLYIKERALEAIGKIVPGMEISISYNRWGKIEYVDVITPTK